jgi:RNA polymerase sigma-70 factor (ECF subfamily)
MDRHGDHLYRFALARVRRPDVAEDVVQETLLAAWRGRAGFAGAAAERTWLTAILKRKVVDWLRQRVRERPAPDGPDPFADDLFTARGTWRVPPGRWGPHDPAERAEFWAVLHACVGKLPPRLHDAFALRYLDEADGATVCQELGLTPTNFWAVLHRSRLRMWRCLSANWFGDGPAEGGG